MTSYHALDTAEEFLVSLPCAREREMPRPRSRDPALPVDYLDPNRVDEFLADDIDINRLLYETVKLLVPDSGDGTNKGVNLYVVNQESEMLELYSPDPRHGNTLTISMNDPTSLPAAAATHKKCLRARRHRHAGVVHALADPNIMTSDSDYPKHLDPKHEPNNSKEIETKLNPIEGNCDPNNAMDPTETKSDIETNINTMKSHLRLDYTGFNNDPKRNKRRPSDAKCDENNLTLNNPKVYPNHDPSDPNHDSADHGHDPSDHDHDLADLDHEPADLNHDPADPNHNRDDLNNDSCDPDPTLPGRPSPRALLAVPVVCPEGRCWSVIEMYDETIEVFSDVSLCLTLTAARWAGAAAAHAASVGLRAGAGRCGVLRVLLEYFGDERSFASALGEIMTIIKAEVKARTSTLYVLHRGGGGLRAEAWAEGWPEGSPEGREEGSAEGSAEGREKGRPEGRRGRQAQFAQKTIMIKLRLKHLFDCVFASLTDADSPLAEAATTGRFLNISLAGDKTTPSPKGLRPPGGSPVDPTTGEVERCAMLAPIGPPGQVTGVVQLTNKEGAGEFTSEDELVFQSHLGCCSLLVSYYRNKQRLAFNRQQQRLTTGLLTRQLRGCGRDARRLRALLERPLPNNFMHSDFHLPEASVPQMAAYTVHILAEAFRGLADRETLGDFALTVYRGYRRNPYHNARHAFVFLHNMHLLVRRHRDRFSFAETIALLLAGLCHDLDHPGVNNNYLAIVDHPLARIFKSSILENYHYKLTHIIIQEKQLLANLTPEDREVVLEDVKYLILSTDLAVYFHTRAQLSEIVAEKRFDWTNDEHRRLVKGIMMTSSDLSACCKPFPFAKKSALSLHEEFYAQGDKERALGLVPLSMMDRRRAANQPAEQLQFLSVVVMPCLLLLQSVCPGVAEWADNCSRTMDGWQNEIRNNSKNYHGHVSLTIPK